MPPEHHEQVEMGIIGGIMKEPAALSRIRRRLNGNAFYDRTLQEIYDVACGMNDKAVQTDIVMLHREAARHIKMDKAALWAKLKDCLEACPWAGLGNIDGYVNVVLEDKNKRDMYNTAGKLQDALRDDADPELITTLRRQIGESGGSWTETELPDMKGVLEEAWQELEARARDPYTRAPGVPSGFPDLDGLTDGFRPGELTMLGAFPSVGKSTWILNVLAHLAVKKDERCYLFSAEMGAKQVYGNLLCILTGIAAKNYRYGNVDIELFRQAKQKLEAAPWRLDDTPGIPVSELCRRVHIACEQDDYAIVLVDYLQRLKPPRSRTRDDIEVSEIAQELKTLARECAVHVLVASGFNRRDTEKTGRPRVQNLRGSGELEHEADLVLIMDAEDLRRTGQESVSTERTLYLDKNRNGPIGWCKLWFDKAKLTFHSQTKGDEDEDDSADAQSLEDQGGPSGGRGRTAPALSGGDGRARQTPLPPTDSGEEGQDVADGEIPF
jgi:replicative DNA helicase